MSVCGHETPTHRQGKLSCQWSSGDGPPVRGAPAAFNLNPLLFPFHPSSGSLPSSSSLTGSEVEALLITTGVLVGDKEACLRAAKHAEQVSDSWTLKVSLFFRRCGVSCGSYARMAQKRTSSQHVLLGVG